MPGPVFPFSRDSPAPDIPSSRSIPLLIRRSSFAPGGAAFRPRKALQVFYFGNAIGESGNSETDAAVTTADVLAARGRISASTMPITNAWDYNRDGVVSSADMSAAQANLTAGDAVLILLAAPALQSPMSNTASLESSALDSPPLVLPGSTVVSFPAANSRDLAPVTGATTTLVPQAATPPAITVTSDATPVTLPASRVPLLTRVPNTTKHASVSPGKSASRTSAVPDTHKKKGHLVNSDLTTGLCNPFL